MFFVTLSNEENQVEKYNLIFQMEVRLNDMYKYLLIAFSKKKSVFCMYLFQIWHFSFESLSRLSLDQIDSRSAVYCGNSTQTCYFANSCNLCQQCLLQSNYIGFLWLIFFSEIIFFTLMTSSSEYFEWSHFKFTLEKIFKNYLAHSGLIHCLVVPDFSMNSPAWSALF